MQCVLLAPPGSFLFVSGRLLAPLLPSFCELKWQGACRLVVFARVGMEGSAKYIYDWLSQWLAETFEEGVRIILVECRENDQTP